MAVTMITAKKLRTLEPRNRLRKCSAIFHNASEVEHPYLLQIIPIIKDTVLGLDCDASRLLDLCSRELDPVVCADICYEILHILDAEPADWDFVQNGELDGSVRKTYPITLVLDRIRSPFNVGSILRSCDSFGVSRVILVEGTASPEHARAQRTARGTDTTVNWEFMSEKDVIDLLSGTSLPVMALELGGQELGGFEFPSEGFGIIGSEEMGVSPELLRVAKDRVSIPISGSKGSLNVSVATGIFLFSWYSQLR